MLRILSLGMSDTEERVKVQAWGGIALQVLQAVIFPLPHWCHGVKRKALMG